MGAEYWASHRALTISTEPALKQQRPPSSGPGANGCERTLWLARLPPAGRADLEWAQRPILFSAILMTFAGSILRADDPGTPPVSNSLSPCKGTSVLSRGRFPA